MFVYFVVLFLHVTQVLGQHKPFTAAVYEAIRKIDQRSDDAVINLEIYEQVAADASQNGADIVVFPEFGILPLTGNRTVYAQFAETIADPLLVTLNPCEAVSRHHPILTKLSCIAKKNRLYLVANIADKQKCNGSETCRPDGIHIFNTNVVFDKNGTLVARYRKRYLYFEKILHDRPEEPNYVYFDTEFGRFGLIICFDILFEEAVKLVENYHIDTLIVPSWWKDELPALTAIQVFSAFAVANHVNVLMSNIHYPERGSIGSGIFTWSHGPVAYSRNPNNEPALVIGTVSNTCDNRDSHVHSSSNTGAGKVNFLISDMSNYTVTALNKASDNVITCHHGLCCHLQYNSSSNVDNYYLGVSRGLRYIKNYFVWYEEVCSLFKCESFVSSTCKHLLSDSDTVFRSFRLTGNFTTKYIYPSVLTSNFLPIVQSNWVFDIYGDRSAELVVKSGPILVANFFGRVYNKDPQYHP